MKDFKTLIDEATEKKSVSIVEYDGENFYRQGASLPNELLLKALEALDGCSKCTDEYLWTSRADAKRVVTEIRAKLEEAAK